MRWCVALVVVVAVVGGLGCMGSPTQITIIDPPEDPWRPPPECVADPDCVAAGSKCCDCPTFAVPVLDEIHQACIDVVCPLETCRDNVRAACDRGRCVLACVATECAQSCDNGFASDDSGCLTCSCAAPVAHGCVEVADCVRVRADCCGCEHGGRDTAVLKQDAPDHEAGLNCGPSSQCPALAGSCLASASPACVQGRCELSTAGALPPNACGRPDLPPCAIGQVCVINGNDRPATEQGVGLCQAGAS